MWLHFLPYWLNLAVLACWPLAFLSFLAVVVRNARLDSAMSKIGSGMSKTSYATTLGIGPLPDEAVLHFRLASAHRLRSSKTSPERGG